MYDTHGFPLGMSLEVLKEKFPNIVFTDLDLSGFIKAAKESSNFNKEKCWLTLEFEYFVNYPEKRDLGKYLLDFHYLEGFRAFLIKKYIEKFGID